MNDVSGLPSRPRIPAHFYVIPMTGDRLQVRSAHRIVVMSGRSVKAVSRLLGLLDGSREVAEILEQFPDIPGEEVTQTLKMLADKGLIEDAATTPETGSAQERFYRMAFRGGREVPDLLGQSRVVVFGLGRVGSHAVAALARSGAGSITGVDSGTVDESLIQCGGLYLPADAGSNRAETAGRRLAGIAPAAVFEGVSAAAEGPGAVAEIIRGSALVLVCEDSPAVSTYRAVNEAALKEGVRWLRAGLEGFEAHLGPCVIPNETACYTCYEYRTRGNWLHYDENAAYEEFLRAEEGRVDYGCPAPAPGFLGNLAALEALKMLTGFSYPQTCGKLWTFNMSTFEARLHNVLRLPRCPSCGATATTPTLAQWSL